MNIKMWPFKPNVNKLIKKMKKKEAKIQKLYTEAESLSSKAFEEKGAKRLADIDDEIKDLKEDMIKMGKLVLEGGKLKRAEDKKVSQEVPQQAPQSMPQQAPQYVPPLQQQVPKQEPQPRIMDTMYNRQPIQKPQVDPFTQHNLELEALRAQQIRNEQLRQQQMERQAVQEQMRQEALMRQQEAEWIEEQRQQELMQQQQMQESQEIDESVESNVVVVIKLINDENVIIESQPSELPAIMNKIAACVNENSIIEIDGKVINPRNVLYFYYE